MAQWRLLRPLFLAYAWIPLLVLLVLLFLLPPLVERKGEAWLTVALRGDARLAATFAEQALRDGQTLDAIGVRLDGITNHRALLLLPGNSPDASAEKTGKAGNLNPVMDTEMSRGASVEVHHRTASDGVAWLYATMPVRHKGGVAAVARVEASLAPVSEMGQSLRMALGVSLAASLLLHLLVSIIASRRAGRSLASVGEGVARFAEGDLDHRIPVPRENTVGRLALALNRMAGRQSERLQDLLRRNQEQEAVLASMVEGVLAVDTEGCIMNFNHAFALLLGRQSAMARGRSVHEVLRKPDLLNFVEATLQSQEPMDGDLELRDTDSDGDRLLRAHGTSLRDEDGRVMGALIVLHDVTELRRLESIRRDFVANVSHELRTPITSIKGFVETLMDGALEDREATERFLGIVLRQADRLNAIIGDLLVLSRLEKENGEEQIPLQPGDVDDVIESALQAFAPAAAEKHIHLQLDLEENLRAFHNARLLEQAVINLVSNAVKYSPEGSSVRVRGRRECNEIRIEVQDEGCGIEARHIPRLFERFYRVDKARSRNLGGTGLGLAIVKHIAQAHHGSVSVESVVGKGSVFSMRLPASPACEQTVASAS